jgi:FixJ family two-component response regulator
LKPFSESALLQTIRAALAKRAAELEARANDYQLRAMVDSMVRDNVSEAKIERAVRAADAPGQGAGSRPSSPAALLRRLTGR